MGQYNEAARQYNIIPYESIASLHENVRTRYEDKAMSIATLKNIVYCKGYYKAANTFIEKRNDGGKKYLLLKTDTHTQSFLCLPAATAEKLIQIDDKLVTRYYLFRRFWI